MLGTTRPNNPPLQLAHEYQPGSVTMTTSPAKGDVTVDVASPPLSTHRSRDEMINTMSKDLQKSEPLIAHLAERHGRGRKKNPAVILLHKVVGVRRHGCLRGWMQMAVHHPSKNFYDPWLISLAVIDSSNNCAVIFEHGRSTGTYELLCAN